jgi:hypothetical protein
MALVAFAASLPPWGSASGGNTLCAGLFHQRWTGVIATDAGESGAPSDHPNRCSVLVRRSTPPARGATVNRVGDRRAVPGVVHLAAGVSFHRHVARAAIRQRCWRCRSRFNRSVKTIITRCLPRWLQALAARDVPAGPLTRGHEHCRRG